jgi:hypothetical protein
MGDRLQEIAGILGTQFFAYLPRLIAGTVLIVAGALAGWFAKRIVIRMALIFNVDRFLLRFYRRRLSLNNEVRRGFLSLLGNIGACIVFLVFLDFALVTWDLDILSRLLEKVISLVPKIATAAVVLGFGWLVSRWVAKSLLTLLDREGVPRPTLISLYARILMMVFFSALAAFELAVATQIVVIAFSTIYLMMGIIAVILVHARFGGKGKKNGIEE